MNPRMISTNPRCNSVIAIAAFLALAVFSSGAGPAAVVKIIKAKEVLIEEQQITILAEARTGLMAINGKRDSVHEGFTYLGKPADRIWVYSDEATFTLRPAEGSSDQRGAWIHLVKAASALKSGDRSGEILYMNATVTFEHCLIGSIDGSGDLLHPMNQGDTEPNAASALPAADEREVSRTRRGISTTLAAGPSPEPTTPHFCSSCITSVPRFLLRGRVC